MNITNSSHTLLETDSKTFITSIPDLVVSMDPVSRTMMRRKLLCNSSTQKSPHHSTSPTKLSNTRLIITRQTTELDVASVHTCHNTHEANSSQSIYSQQPSSHNNYNCTNTKPDEGGLTRRYNGDANHPNEYMRI